LKPLHAALEVFTKKPSELKWLTGTKQRREQLLLLILAHTIYLVHEKKKDKEDKVLVETLDKIDHAVEKNTGTDVVYDPKGLTRFTMLHVHRLTSGASPIQWKQSGMLNGYLQEYGKKQTKQSKQYAALAVAIKKLDRCIRSHKGK